MIGEVIRWLDRKGYGFISTENDEDVFVHYSGIKGTVSLVKGQKVEFDVEFSNKGPRAVNVRVIG